MGELHRLMMACPDVEGVQACPAPGWRAAAARDAKVIPGFRGKTGIAGALAIAVLAAPAFAPAPDQAAPAPPAAAPEPTHDHGAPEAHAPPEGGFKRTSAPAEAYVYIGWPNDGEVIRTTHIKVWFGTRNFGVAPAGTYKPNTGHHHLLIDTALPPMDQPIPNDKNHLHFGLGQTETFIDLPPGTHTLQILMGDGDHVPHDPPLMSKKITIHVQGGENRVAGTAQ
jgi:hypothetical protein